MIALLVHDSNVVSDGFNIGHTEFTLSSDVPTTLLIVPPSRKLQIDEPVVWVC
jgi:hypothetical protein